jgi:glutathione S-transferase
MEALRWLMFDNHKFTPPFATLRFMIGIRGVEESPLTEFLRAQAQSAFEIVDEHLANRDFVLGSYPSIVDISMVGYQYYDEESRFDRSRFRNIEGWKGRLKSLPNWRHPYDLMPRAIGRTSSIDSKLPNTK